MKTTMEKQTETTPQWYLHHQQKAEKRFQELPWPTGKQEEWRRTDITGINFQGYRQLLIQETGNARATLPRDFNAGVDAYIGFNETRCRQLYLSPGLEEKGIYLAPWHKAREEKSAIIQAHLSPSRLNSKFTAWNQSLISHGLLLHVPAGVALKNPLILDLQGTAPGLLYSPYVMVIMEEGSEARLVLRYQGSGKNLWNGVADFQVGLDARLNINLVQLIDDDGLFFHDTLIKAQRNAEVNLLEAQLGGGLVKTNTESELVEKGAQVQLSGIYLSTRNRHLDLRTVQHHRAPDTLSRSLYKGAVQDKGRSVFQGLIHVEPEAVRSDAYLSNRNLLLNDGARADSIPSLKIETNDVKCSHGSATGKISGEELFYLMSRGFSRAEARKVLVTSYFQELTRQAPEMIGQEILKTLKKRLE